MEEDKDKREKELEKMFFNAQFLAANFPDIAELFAKAESNAELFQAFKNGKETYEYEQESKGNRNFHDRFKESNLKDEFNEKGRNADKDQEPDR